MMNRRRQRRPGVGLHANLSFVPNVPEALELGRGTAGGIENGRDVFADKTRLFKGGGEGAGFSHTHARARARTHARTHTRPDTARAQPLSQDKAGRARGL